MPATTPRYALPYPASADPADVPTDVHNLASAVELALGGPTKGGYGTTLPASPVDGQEFVLVDSATNPTYQWRFRYNAGSTSPYKWEFMGGGHLSAVPTGSMTTTSTGFVNLTGGPSLTAPRAGDYLVRWGLTAYCNAFTSAYVGQAQLLFGGTASGIAQAGFGVGFSGFSVAGPSSAYGARANGDVLTIQCQNDRAGAGTTAWSNGWFELVPRRVS